MRGWIAIIIGAIVIFSMCYLGESWIREMHFIVND